MPQPSDIEIARAARQAADPGDRRRPRHPARSTCCPSATTRPRCRRTSSPALDGRPDGKLILVTAINPTPAGEGKTTTTVGLGDGLNAIGKRAMICLREPSLGPCFGMKGGAAGGGYAQVVPMEDINLHFTGDFHAITAAHNLLSAMIDNHIYWGNALDIDPRRIVWRRVMDMNDRALREIVCSLGGVRQRLPARGRLRHHRGLGGDGDPLPRRATSRTWSGGSATSSSAYTRDRRPVHARDLKADGAMAVLLAQAMQPNLVQTLENNPAFVHGGPFANIAHGCNSVVATRTALKLADFVVTEAGFGADLGAEKFFDIKCRKAGLHPAAAVIVATVRALKMNGGVAQRRPRGRERGGGAARAAPTSAGTSPTSGRFGVPAVVAINHFASDTEAEIAAVKDYVAAHGAEAILCRHWAEGLEGHRRARARGSRRSPSPGRRSSTCSIPTRCRCSRRSRPSPSASTAPTRCWPTPASATQLHAWEEAGYGDLPICMAKTQYSFSTDPDAARRADRLRRAGPRGAAGGRRGVRRGDLRRDHDHARPAARALGRGDPAGRRGA